MNICHIISGDLWAGAECQVVNLLSELRKNAELGLTAVTFNHGRLTAELRGLSVRVTCLPEKELSALGILLDIQKHISGNKVDIIHCHGHKEHILGCAAGVLSKRRPKVVRTLHGMPEPFSGFAKIRSGFFDKLQEIILRYFTDKIIVVSRDMEGRLSGKSWAKKIVCIRNGIDIDKVKATVPMDEMRRRLGIMEDDFVIGTACRLVPIKRMDTLLEAFSVVNRNHPHTLLVIGGDGPLRGELQRQAEDLRVASRTKFLGHRDDIYDVMSTFDIFVMTSEHEGMPIVLLEALALGIPIVAPSVGGIPEVVSCSGQLPRETYTSEQNIAALLDEFIVESNGAISARGRLPTNLSQEFMAETTAVKTSNLYESIVRD